jgi:hypothetical protein
MANKIMTYIVVKYPMFIKTRIGHGLVWFLVRAQRLSKRR